MSARHLADVCSANQAWISQPAAWMAVLFGDIWQMSCRCPPDTWQTSAQTSAAFMDIWQMSCRCLDIYPATSTRHLPDVCSVNFFFRCVFYCRSRSTRRCSCIGPVCCPGRNCCAPTRAFEAKNAATMFSWMLLEKNGLQF